MKIHTFVAVICLSLLTPTLFGQTPPTISEEARKHFVMGTTLFRDAKTANDFSQVERELKQAVDLAPQWPEARYDLALAEEQAGDYSSAMADLKRYQQFKLSDTDARTVQDKIYTLEAKAGAVAKKQAEQQAVARAEEAKYGWLLGRWTFVMTGDGWTGDGIILANKDGNRVELKLIQNTLHMHGKDYPSTAEIAEAAPLIRGTVSPSGAIAWEGKGDDTPGCPVVGWFPVPLDISGDHRTIKYDQQRVNGSCFRTKPDSYTLRHE